MDFFNVVEVERARELILEILGELELESEKVSILESGDRILSENIVSHVNVPDFNRSTMDGYAIVAQDSHGATQTIPSMLQLIGEVKMGQLTEIEIKSGQAAYIPTGGMIPKGANAVVMIENTEKMDEESLLVYSAVSEGQNIVYSGDDIEKGQSVLEKGRRINAEVVGALAALGINQVQVYKKLRFTIISTGDEIIPIDKELTPGKIRDINSYALQILVEKIGGQVVHKSIVRDNYDLLQAEVQSAVKDSDIVLISGGSSVGTRDYTDKVINSLGGRGVLAHGVSIKPGKPTIIGDHYGKLLIGLPGHPVSSIIVFKSLIESALKERLGDDSIETSIMAKMDSNFPASPGRETYQMVSLRREEDGYHGVPTHGKSGMITLLSDSHGYIVIERHEEGVEKGQMRKVFLL